MFEQSYLRATGQLWKLCVFMLAPILGVLLVGISLSMISSRPRLALVLLLGGIGLAIVGFVWSSLATQCPRCQTRLLWKAFAIRLIVSGQAKKFAQYLTDQKILQTNEKAVEGYRQESYCCR